MTTRPRLYTSKSQVVGLVAFALFAVFAVVFLTADFGAAETFNGAEEITATIGYAMINLDAGTLPSEGFLIAFEMIDVVLVAALAATVMLARRETDEEGGLLPLTDGGQAVDRQETANRTGGEAQSVNGETQEDDRGGDR